jgi:hypothetical protein
MKMKISQVIAVGVGILLFAISIKTTSDNRLLHQQVAAQRELIEQKSQLVDSLHDELFNANCIIGRVELSLEHLNEVEPKAFIEYSKYYDHETE